MHRAPFCFAWCCSCSISHPRSQPFHCVQVLTAWLVQLKDIPIMAAAVLHALAVLARGAAPVRTALLAHKEVVPAITKCLR